VIACVNDTYANINTLADGLVSNERNPLVLFGLEKYAIAGYSGTFTFNSPLETVALIASIIALLGVKGANVNPYITNFPFGEAGGYATNALHNLKLPFLAYQSTKNFTVAQRQELKGSKVSLLQILGNAVQTSTLYTLTTEPNGTFLERELQVQVIKEYLVKSLVNEYSNAFVSASPNAIVQGRVIA
jgi:hypothetical protein